MASVLLHVNDSIMYDRPVGQEGDLVSRHLGVIHVKLPKSAPHSRGGADQEAASPFAGIIQIKFERYNLRTSPSPTRHSCEESLDVSAQIQWTETSLNTRHACFRFEKIPVDVMSTLLDRDNPRGRRGGALCPRCFLHGIVPVVLSESDEMKISRFGCNVRNFVRKSEFSRFIRSFSWYRRALVRFNKSLICSISVGDGGAVRGMKYLNRQAA